MDAESKTSTPDSGPKWNEIELRDAWMKEAGEQTLETLPNFIQKLATFKHDYGTICRAIAAGAIATMKAMNRGPQGGISGFQAGCIMWDVMHEWGVFGDGPLRVQNFKDLLYPQYKYKFTSIPKDHWIEIQAVAKRELEKFPVTGSNTVREHMKSVVQGIVPFGLTVEDDA